MVVNIHTYTHMHAHTHTEDLREHQSWSDVEKDS